VGEGSGFFSDEPEGMMVAPGEYSVTLSKEIAGVVKQISVPQSFVVEPLRHGVLQGAEPQEVVAFWRQLSATQDAAAVTAKKLSDAIKRTEQLKKAMKNSLAEHGTLDIALNQIINDLHLIDRQMNGFRTKQQVGEKTHVTIWSRLSAASIGTLLSTYGPTATHKRSLAIANEDYAVLKKQVDAVVDKRLPAFEQDLQAIGAPVVF